LQPPGTPQKHLYDFIDSAAVSNLEGTLRACIDRYNHAHAILTESNDAFDTSLDNLHSSIENVPLTPTSASNPSPIPSLYQDLEAHAKEAAQAFQSLVSHYDLCVTALRHTEGGSAAATQATGSLPHNSASEFAAPPEPMTSQSRQEMIQVLVKDAYEVESVVHEMRTHESEMTLLTQQIENHMLALQSEAEALSAVLQMISQITADVKFHINTSRALHTCWQNDTQPTLLAGIEEWDNQRAFYERFDLAYAELLVEISARRRRYEKARRRAEDAQRELDRLHGEDERCREMFTLAQGDFLPLDIWPGLREKPRRYEVRAVVEGDDGEDEGEMGGSIPLLGRNVVERALGRVKRRM
jgi:autophagy-related protein 17